MTGGEIKLTAQKHFHHKVKCGHCGMAHTVRHGKKATEELMSHVMTPHGLALVKEHADMHGDGVWDFIKPGLSSLAKTILPKATEFIGKKAGDFVEKKFGSTAADLVRKGVAKAGEFAQAKADKHLGSGASFKTMLQEAGGVREDAHHILESIEREVHGGSAKQHHHPHAHRKEEWDEHETSHKSHKHQTKKGSGVGGTHNPWVAFMKAHPGVPLKKLSEMYHSEKESGSGFFP
jgi:hypothetical protein